MMVPVFFKKTTSFFVFDNYLLVSIANKIGAKVKSTNEIAIIPTIIFWFFLKNSITLISTMLNINILHAKNIFYKKFTSAVKMSEKNS